MAPKAVHRAVRTACPEAAPWVDFCYGDPSRPLPFTLQSALPSAPRSPTTGSSQGTLLQSRTSSGVLCACLSSWPLGFPGKSLVIPSCATSADFVRCEWIVSGNFKLLGTALGSHEWCTELLHRQVAKARALLEAIGRYDDAQGVFSHKVLRWSKILHNSRTVPLPPSLPPTPSPPRYLGGSLKQNTGTGQQ